MRESASMRWRTCGAVGLKCRPVGPGGIRRVLSISVKFVSSHVVVSCSMVVAFSEFRNGFRRWRFRNLSLYLFAAWEADIYSWLDAYIHAVKF